MNDFCNLYWRLDATTKTTEKVAALKDYFEVAQPSNAAWAIYFLVGRRIKRLVGTKLLRQWAIEKAELTTWLFEECYDRVGDLAETISLVLPPNESGEDIALQDLIEQHLLPLRSAESEQQRSKILELWQRFDQRQLFVLGKLMTGGFRVGVSKKLITRALAQHAHIDPATIAHRLMGDWEPDADFYNLLVDPNEQETAFSKPYPFFLANPLKDGPDLTLGQPQDWIAEWKWDGIRAQVIRRGGETFIWSRGEELVTEQFPEVATSAASLPDGTVLDGELLGWDDAESKPLEFSQLQRRLGRKKLGKKLLSEVPVVLLAFDLIEHDGEDIRSLSLTQRQERLTEVIQQASITPAKPNQSAGELFRTEKEPTRTSSILIPPAVATGGRVQGDRVQTWKELEAIREDAREFRAEGLMLKRHDSAYQVGRPVGDWWKWKVDPYTIDAVMIYAQRGHGRRASLYSDYTFALWKDGELVPFAKAYSGLTDAEIRKVDAFVRKNTHEKFGPVRSVTPELVFELAFENIQRSPRHKSGIAVRFPRISRWRHDKKPADADKLETILSMLEG